MQQALERFFNEPTAARFRSAQRALRRASLDVPEAAQLATLEQHVCSGEFCEALDLYAEMLPAWALSPRTHMLAARAAAQLSAAEDAELERFMALTCLDGLLASGGGDLRRPYRPTYLADEYDLIGVLGRRIVRQKFLAGAAGRRLDVIECDDGSQVCFDTENLLAAGGRGRERRRLKAGLAFAL